MIPRSRPLARRPSRCVILLGACLLGLAASLDAQVASGIDSPAGSSAIDGTREGQDQANVQAASDSNSVLGSSSTGCREVSPKRLVPNILQDQKPIWLFPLHVVKGEHLKPTLIVAGATAALVALDPYDEPYFRNSSGFKSFKTGPLRGRNTTLGITIAPAGLYLAGLLKKDSYAENTALLAAEALADTQVLTLGMKGIDGRLHPSDIPPHGDFTHTWFKYGGTVGNPGSFPSGHAISAFAVASVVSARYGRHRWVPWVVYGLASFVALSRIPDQAHFPSDVFAGAALGYAVSRFVVLPQR
jgi:membrane-associated phospholipid phosphatase